jgi:hypothetical protein
VESSTTRIGGISYHQVLGARNQRNFKLSPRSQGGFWSGSFFPTCDPLTAPDLGVGITPSPEPRGILPLESAENPDGQWNTAELLCYGTASVHLVNGKPQAILANHRLLPEAKPVSKGRLSIEFNGVTPAGSPIYYRNIRLRPIRALPLKYAKVLEKAPAPPALPDLSPPATSPAWKKTIAGLSPGHQIAAVSVRLEQLNPGFEGSALGNRIENDQVVSLKLLTMKAKDLTPLAALPHLTELNCRGPDMGQGILSDLTPIAGLPLTSLSCGVNPISDLKPIAGLRLKGLEIVRTQVEDLTPLRGMPLEDLRCDEELARKHEALLKGITTLKTINREPAARFWEKGKKP